MTRVFRPWARLISAASVLVAGVCAVVAAPALISPASAAANADCTVGEPPTVNGIVEITTPGQLKWIATNTVSLSATIKQLNDLDLTGCGNWPGIGSDANKFQGTYDGDGKTISNLDIVVAGAANTSTFYQGLFRYTRNATISGLTLQHVTVSAANQSYVGGLIGYADRTNVSGVQASNVTVTANDDAGGLIGRSEMGSGIPMSIANVSVSGTVSGGFNVGGVIGRLVLTNGAMTMTNLMGDVAVSGTGGNIGGVIGRLSDGGSTATALISSVHAVGSVTGSGTAYSLGGLIGVADPLRGAVTVQHSTAAVAVVTSGSGADLGGLIGEIELAQDGLTSFTVHNSHATGNVTSTATGSGSRNLGGLIGNLRLVSSPGGMAFATVSASSASGSVLGQSTLGDGNNSVGGLIGRLDASRPAIMTVIDSEYTGTTVTAATSDAIGGLIGRTNVGTSVSAITIARVTSSATTQGRDYVGGLAGYLEADNGGTISLTDVSATSTVQADENSGGLIGYAEADRGGAVTVSDSRAEGAATGSTAVGGLIGYAGPSRSSTSAVNISHVAADVDVTASAGPAGGLVGAIGIADYEIEGIVRVEHATASGDVVGTNSAQGIGGLVGLVLPDGSQPTEITLHDTHASGSVQSPGDNVGGLVGHILGPQTLGQLIDVTISASTASGEVRGDDQVGGMVGRAEVQGNMALVVTDSEAFGPGVLALDDKVGGLIGQVTVDGGSSFALSRVTASATVTGLGVDSEYVGGLIGDLYLTGSGGSASISRAFATGVVTTSGDAVGGLIGNTSQLFDTSSLLVHESFASGNVTGRRQVGGLIGYADGRRSTVSASFARGAVTATERTAGGLFGFVAGSPDPTQFVAQDVYATGNVSGPTRVGGIIGEASIAVDLGLVRLYHSGTLTGSTDVGGVIGRNTADAPNVWTVTSVYYPTGNGTRTDFGTATSLTDLKLITTFQGWSITNGDADLTKVWGICSGSTYPFLMWQTQLAAGLPGAASCSGGGGGGGDGGGNIGSLNPGVTELVTQPVPTPTTTTPPSTTTTVPPTTVAPSNDTPIPVPVDGVLPELPAGDVMVVEDGEPVAVEVFVENDTELVVQSSRFELRLEGDCSEAACTIDTTPEGREVLTLEENGKANTQGEGFLPGSRVDVWLFSEPRYLGQLTVRADGTFEGDVDLGDIDVGEHTLQVNGLSQTGAERSANLGVIVNPDQAPTPGPGVLPATGTSTTPLWLVALTLLGLGLVATSRRRTA